MGACPVARGNGGLFLFSAKSDGLYFNTGVEQALQSVDFIGFPIQF